MRHLALAVTDQERSRRFYEAYFGFDAKPSRRYDGDVLMLYDADGFSLALGPTDEPVTLPGFLHFGVHMPPPSRCASSATGSPPTASRSSRSGTSPTT
jgi:catechol 2,3-dioxygenase-like lactoylglutathione lyase family enzyme